MRKALMIAVASVAFAAPAFAQSNYENYEYNPAAPAEVTTGAVAGTAAGIGLSEGWFGGTVGSSALAATTAGAIAGGGVAGVGVAAGLDAVTQRCRGAAALFRLNYEECAQRQAAMDAQSDRLVMRQRHASRTERQRVIR
jgi:hypothetical protein